MRSIYALPLILVATFSFTNLAVARTGVDKGPAAGQPAGKPGEARLTGTIFKHNERSQLVFDLRLAQPLARYVVKGAASTKGGILKDSVSFESVHATKFAGGAEIREYDNGGTMSVGHRQRQLDAILAGVPVRGIMVQGKWVNDAIFFDRGLSVGGVNSAGVLNYHSIRKFYVAENLAFGSYKISATTSNNRVLDYFSANRNNYMLVQMKFGNLTAEGRINFVDVERQSCSTDDDGDTTCVDITISTTGTFDVVVKRTDGKPVEISATGDDAQNEADLRALLAFWQLSAFDVFAE